MGYTLVMQNAKPIPLHVRDARNAAKKKAPLPKPPLEAAMFAHFGIAEARELEEFEGYAVSPDGRVFSCRIANKWKDKTNPTPSFGSQWRELNPGRLCGYPSVEMAGRKKTVHSLVLTAFVGTRPEGAQACHYNGIPTDNRVENLRWGTVQDNADDKARHGSHKGMKHIKAKLTDDDVREIYRRAVNGDSSKVLCESFGLARPSIIRIIRGEGWTHIERPRELDMQFRLAGSWVRWGIWHHRAKQKGVSFDEYAGMPKQENYHKAKKEKELEVGE